MSICYQKASGKILDEFAEVMKTHHRHLVSAGVSVDLLIAFDDTAMDADEIPQRDSEHALKFEGFEIDVTRQMQAKAASRIDEREPILKAHGYPAIATVKITSLKDRAKGVADVEIIVDEEKMARMTAAERAAVFDHELTHCELQINERGAPKRDDLGRPKLKIRPHDVQVGWFTEVVERHGRNAAEVLGLESMLQNAPEQLALPGFE